MQPRHDIDSRNIMCAEFMERQNIKWVLRKCSPPNFGTTRFWSSNVVAAIKETAFELCSTAVPSQSIWICYLSKCLRLDLLTQSTETTTHAWWEKRIALHIADELYIGSHICNQLFMHEKYLANWNLYKPMKFRIFQRPSDKKELFKFAWKKSVEMGTNFTVLFFMGTWKTAGKSSK